MKWRIIARNKYHQYTMHTLNVVLLIIFVELGYGATRSTEGPCAIDRLLSKFKMIDPTAKKNMKNLIID
jgi:hypothetical protein